MKAARHTFRCTAPALLPATPWGRLALAAGLEDAVAVGGSGAAVQLHSAQHRQVGHGMSAEARTLRSSICVANDPAGSAFVSSTRSAAQRRVKRLATPSIEDNRICYGCINVPVAFYETHLRPLFAPHKAVVHVLPDSKSLRDGFW